MPTVNDLFKEKWLTNPNLTLIAVNRDDHIFYEIYDAKDSNEEKNIVHFLNTKCNLNHKKYNYYEDKLEPNIFAAKISFEHINTYLIFKYTNGSDFIHIYGYNAEFKTIIENHFEDFDMRMNPYKYHLPCGCLIKNKCHDIKHQQNYEYDDDGRYMGYDDGYDFYTD
jgi:hypothetical protein